MKFVHMAYDSNGCEGKRYNVVRCCLYYATPGPGVAYTIYGSCLVWANAIVIKALTVTGYVSVSVRQAC
jgi:hypothetical protein